MQIAAHDYILNRNPPPTSNAPTSNLINCGRPTLIFPTTLIFPARIHFLLRDATQSAVMPQYVVRLSVCLSVRDVRVFFFSHIAWNYFENNFTAE